MSENKFHVKVDSIITKEKGKEFFLLEYILDPGDPKFDDLPTEQLQEGEEYYMTFVKVKKDVPPPFNQ